MCLLDLLQNSTLMAVRTFFRVTSLKIHWIKRALAKAKTSFSRIALASVYFIPASIIVRMYLLCFLEVFNPIQMNPFVWNFRSNEFKGVLLGRGGRGLFLMNLPLHLRLDAVLNIFPCCWPPTLFLGRFGCEHRDLHNLSFELCRLFILHHSSWSTTHKTR